MRHLRLVFAVSLRQLRIFWRSKWNPIFLVIPLVFLYTIFTGIFSNPADGEAPESFKLGVADLDASDGSSDLLVTLSQMIPVETHQAGTAMDRAGLQEAILDGVFRAGIVIPKGYGENRYFWDEGHQQVTVLVNPAQAFMAGIATGALEMAGALILLEEDGRLKGQKLPVIAGSPQLIASETVLLTERSAAPLPPMSLLFLAGLVPMFLLFNSQGAAAGFLAELQSGAVRRFLAAPVRPGHILVGQMLYSMLMALFQCAVVFVYAALVFDAPLLAAAPALMVFALATASATVGFGMFAASVARTPEQLYAVGSVAVLAMSAIGGSMIPRPFLPGWLQELGLFTINGWASEGFYHVVQSGSLGPSILHALVLLGVGATLASLGAVLITRRFRGGIPQTG